MTDNRAYINIVINGNSTFIANNAINMPYGKNISIIALEEWISEDKKTKWILYRVLYSYGKVKEWVRKAKDNDIGMMEGPDLFLLMNENDKTIMSVWQTRMEALEIVLNKKSGIATQLYPLSGDVENLFEIMIHSLEKETGCKTITRYCIPDVEFLCDWKIVVPPKSKQNDNDKNKDKDKDKDNVDKQ